MRVWGWLRRLFSPRRSSSGGERFGDAWMSDRLAPQEFRPAEPKPELPDSDGDRWWER